MRTLLGSRFSAALAASVFFGLTSIASIASAQFVSFSYEQTDLSTGSGTLFGTVDGISLSGVLPVATVTQNDGNNRPLPEGMIGYMDGYQNLGTSGNDYGVHLGWEGSVTLTGSRVISPTELELVELEVDLIIAGDGTPDADWAYSAVVTDDDGQGNDAFGEYRIAGWIGNPKEGHRHSGDTQTFVQGAVDSFVMGGTHGQVVSLALRRKR